MSSSKVTAVKPLHTVDNTAKPSGARLRRWLDLLGPGVVTGASDDDPSGIGTYSQVGAQFGLGFLWLMLFSFPLMLAAQLVSARIGRVTGAGLAAGLRQLCPAWVLSPLIGLLLVANTINIGADLGAMGAATQLLAGGHPVWYTAGFGLLSLLLQVFIPYRRYVMVLKWMTLALFAYVATALMVDVPWPQVLANTLIPRMGLSAESVTAVVAVLGTTISPYLFFWQASQEVEEQQAARSEQPLKQAPWQAARQLGQVRQGTVVGMAVSNVVAFFIMLTAAVTLHAHGVHDVDSAAQAAQALRPVAGALASAVFAAGIIGTGLLAVPVLAGSAAYAVGESLRWRVGLEREPSQAVGFYGVIAIATLAGIAMNFAHVNPMKALYWTSVINGVIAVPILAAVMVVAARRRVMGRFVVSGPLRWFGWLTTLVMAVCALALWWV